MFGHHDTAVLRKPNKSQSMKYFKSGCDLKNVSLVVNRNGIYSKWFSIQQ